MDLHAPVDVVYLWVDGGDPVWRQKLRHAETRLGVGQRRAHPGITVIDHRALIPAAVLPTSDSGNIESYIHRIPNLSERYCYFNDDVFFGALYFFCINDTTDDAHACDPRLSQVRTALARLFPTPSRFEKPLPPGKTGVHKRQPARAQALSA